MAAMDNILITGGAGFIGSSLLSRLSREERNITVIDNLSTGNEENLKPFLSSKNFQFLNFDLLESDKLKEVIGKSDVVFHIAASADVRTGLINTYTDFINNIVVTRNVLESMLKTERCKKIIFTSSSVIYGEPTKIPTPENYGPLEPISIYGACKLACEALISGYAKTFGLSAVIFRLANIIGPSSNHGVIVDFLNKLYDSNGRALEILGDGTQNKSYLYIDDSVDALIMGLQQFDSQFEIFNVGSDDQISVNSIAKIIIDQAGFKDTRIRFDIKEKDGRGWRGDIKNMLLSVDKLKEYGWKIRHSSSESVSITVREILEQKDGNPHLNELD
jgi:UDP-glucose 4-epimerase